MKTKTAIIDGKEVEVAQIMPMEPGVIVGEHGMIASGKGESKPLPVFWYLVYRYNECNFELWSLDHLDQEAADGKIIWGRINFGNKIDTPNPARLVRICSPRENDWLNNLKTNHPKKFKQFMEDQKNWPFYDLTKYNPKPKLHELDELSVDPRA